MKSLVRPAFAGISVVSMLAAITVAGAQKPAPATSYAKVDKIIQAKCIGCHQGAHPAGGVNLKDYAAVMGGKYRGKPLVVAKNAKASVLSNAVHGTGGVAKMPPGGDLPATDQKTIDAWIAAGAKK